MHNTLLTTITIACAAIAAHGYVLKATSPPPSTTTTEPLSF